MDSAMEKERKEEQEQEEKNGAQSVEREIALKRAAKLLLPRAVKTRTGGGKEWSRRHGDDPGTTDLLPYHRKKLRALLQALLRQHDFSTAAGVVSALLGAGNVSDQKLERDFAYYWAAMEVLRQMEGSSNSKATSLKIKRLYRILHRKQRNVKLRGRVQLELALYLLSQGDSDSYEAAYNEIRPLVDVHPFRDDATMNLCHGLILHQLWHDRAVVDVEKLFIEDIGRKPGNSSQDYEEGCGENDTMEVKEKMEHHSIDVAGTSSPSNWLLEQQRDFELRENLAALDISGNSCGSTQGLQQQGLYEGDEHEHQHNNSWQTAAVLWSSDLDKRLFPVPLPQPKTTSVYMVPMVSSRTRDAHGNAIKYLRQARTLAANMTPALLPLVQLLLATGDVKGAMEEIDNVCKNPHLLPLSIKALLLESLNSKHTRQISQCYEAILQINPSSANTLQALINLHTTGKYRAERLVDCISSHLDLEQGSLEVWQQLATCLLFLEQRSGKEPRQNSRQRREDVNEDGVRTSHMPASSTFEAWWNRTWEERREWWVHKHFDSRSIPVEQEEDGGWQRIVYKVACLIHIMGPGTEYETQVCAALERLNAESLLAIVQLHSRVVHEHLS
ncbi:unnamed protein product [Sphagnum jensenii]|uniref:Uncharacterized protein n=1 Tax=Sphagnum jensenii TaxID=128206 RepID=A0ABP1C3A4_9BRYO